VGQFSKAYRPEQHYMRGPGPKWQAKHASALVSAASAQRAANVRRSADEDLPRSVWIVPAAALVLIGFAAVVALA
jgi:hypothetical protein